MTKSIKGIATAAFLSGLGVALSATLAEASTQETCTVNGVTFQPAYGAGSSVPVDLLLVGCTDGTSYVAYVGTPSNGGCYSTTSAVQAMTAVALTARTSGNAVTIWWSSVSCPGNGGAKIINSITM